MKLSRQHKAYLGILGVAMIGLIADRTIFQPSEAVAESPQDLLVTQPGSSGGPATAKAIHAPLAVQPIAARLKTIAQAEPFEATAARDVFAIPWDGNNTSTGSPGGATTEDSIRSFISRHRLTAVMGTGARGCGVIDGKLLHLGDTLDGLKLNSVGARSAIFVSGPTQVELSLCRQGSDGNSQNKADGPS